MIWRLLAVCLWMLVGGVAQAANPLALWQIVHGRCVPDEIDHGSPKPCEQVDRQGGFAVLKDIRGREQFLLIPTARITGIESPALLAPGAENYFAEAWEQIGRVEGRLNRSLPRDDLALAINSRDGRTQEQLHIHIDCVSRPVHAALRREIGQIGPAWHALASSLAGHHYRAMRIDGAQLGMANPFRLLAASLADPAATMGEHTLVLIGVAAPHPGFLLLDDQARPADLDTASGEELQDHDCTIAH